MLSYVPAWMPKLTDGDIPDHVPLTDFVFNDTYRPYKCDESPTPFVDSINGIGFTVQKTRQRVEWLAAGLAAHLNIDISSGDVFDRVVGVFAVNNVSSQGPESSSVSFLTISDPRTNYCLGCPSNERRRRTSKRCLHTV
jgi:hypothetical protein